MKRLNSILTICGCYLLAVNGAANAAERNDGARAQAKKAVLSRIKTPYTARCGKFTRVTAAYACMTVTVSNAREGYAGDQQAMLGKIGKTWFALDLKDVSHEFCVDVMKKMAAEDRAAAAAPGAVISRQDDSPVQNEAN